MHSASRYYGYLKDRKMRNKARTQEQIRRRFAFSSSLIIFLIAFFLLSTWLRGIGSMETAAPEVAATVYDIQLDSMVHAMFGDSVKVAWTGEFVQVPFNESILPEVNERERAEISLELYRSSPVSERSAQKEQELARKVEEARRIAEEAKERYMGRSLCTARPVRLEGEHSCYTCFQSYSETEGTSRIDGLLKTEKK